MKTRFLTVWLAAAGALVCARAGFAQGTGAAPAGITIPASSVVRSTGTVQQVHTNLKILNFAGGITGTPQLFGPPYGGYFYETPASIACIYGLQPAVAGCNPNYPYNPNGASLNPNGGAKAIAIVDAFDDPNATADLAHFSNQFGIPAANFTVVFAPSGPASTGTPGTCPGPTPAARPPSAAGTGWDVEESLDIEWAHAMAPLAALYLVEAQSNSDADLFCAVTMASNLVATAGGGEISMSWGESEFVTGNPLGPETNFDAVFTKPNVVYFASSGDGPGTSYPSASPNVVSVGGTSLSTNASTGNFINENVWQDGGGGQSLYEPKPAYQSGISVATKRATPDVAADANPYTGVWVYDSLPAPAPAPSCTPPNCWYIVGGTSVASPVWTGITNAAGGFSVSTQAELTKLYKDPASNFNDITLGSCGLYLGFFAGTGWDFCTGLGSPRTYAGPSRPSVLTLAPPSSTGTAGVPYSSYLVASGGLPPYTFSINLTPSPAGCCGAATFNVNATTGLLTGTPAGPAGAISFTAQVTDYYGETATTSGVITISVGAPPPLSSGVCNGTYTSQSAAGNLTVPAGGVCTLVGGSVGGTVTVAGNGALSCSNNTAFYNTISLTGSGGMLSMNSCSINNPNNTSSVTAASPAAVTLNNVGANYTVQVNGATGPVNIQSSKIYGNLVLTNNTGGVAINKNYINNTLSCSGNTPAPTETATPNNVVGSATGQCTGF